MRRVLLVVLLGVPALAACGSEPAAPASTGPPASAESVPAAAPDVEAPGLEADTVGWTVGVVDLGADGDDQAVLTDLRVGRHEGFDRVVFELDRAPAVHVEYVDRPVRACGSGEVVELPGEGWLEVRLGGARGHTEAGEPTVPVARREPGYPSVLALARTCDFEGVVTWVAGVEAPTPFRVARVEDPARVVVDVRHE